CFCTHFNLSFSSHPGDKNILKRKPFRRAGLRKLLQKETPDCTVRGNACCFFRRCLQNSENSDKYVLFSHPDYTVGTGIPSYQKVTGSAAVKQFADYTAGWDLHPTPKILFLLRVII